MLLDEAGGEIDGFADVLPIPRLVRMVAAGEPGDLDRRRELVPRDVGGSPERIALPLDDQRPRLQPREVLCPELLRLSGRMERIAEADQGADAQLVRDEA